LFRTTQELTDVFLGRRDLERKLVSTTKSLSEAISKKIHMSVDFECLYEVVGRLQHSLKLEDLKSLLAALARYFREDLLQALIE